jgi:cyclopropane fatty-acyl-phospholipid synthase-like methyltransferase
MPAVDSPIHLQMLRDSYRRGDTDETKFYGREWGDPNDNPFLTLVRDQFIQPYVNLGHTALEIGPGGGRWTRYLLSFQRIYVVDLHQELLDELGKKYRVPHLTPIKGSGTNLPGIPPNTIDYFFSFGVFVHLDAPIIEAYLQSLFIVAKADANLVIQYSDKRKAEAAAEKSFAENDPDRMRRMVTDAGFIVVEENLTALPHSAVVRFRRRRANERSF